MTKDELIALIHSAIKETSIDCERLTDFEQDPDEIVMRFFDLEEEEENFEYWTWTHDNGYHTDDSYDYM